MASTFIRHFVGILGWACLFAVAGALALWTIVEHYLSVKSALELVGFEQQEMWRDPLVGRVLSAFMPEATLPQAVALTIAVTEALALLIVCEVVTRIVRLLHHRRAMQDLGNDAEAREAVVQVWERVALLAVIGTVLVVALRYDFELFRLRAVAGSLGMELPEEVARLQDWAALASDPDRPVLGDAGPHRRVGVPGLHRARLLRASLLPRQGGRAFREADGAGRRLAGRGARGRRGGIRRRASRRRSGRGAGR